MEGGSLAEFALEPIFAALKFNQIAGDVSPQAGARCPPGFGILQAEELLEDFF